MIINSSSIETLDPTILNDLPSRQLIRKFGGPRDFIELNVFDLNNNLIINNPNFKDYQPISSTVDENGLFQSIDINFTQVLKDYGLSTGVYRSVYSFQRREITNYPIRPFFISEISPSRTEIKIQSTKFNGEELADAYYNISNTLNGSTFVKDLNVNLKNALYFLVINLDLETTTNSILVKLYEPLPLSVNINDTLGFIEEVINPLEVNVNLGEGTTNANQGTPIKGPNFNVDFRINAPISSEFKSYDDVLAQGAITSSNDNLLNYLSGSIPVDLEFDNPNTPSGYTFENFIHFSSAVERLKNFEYKLELIETYQSEIDILNTITGDVSASKEVSSEKASWERKQSNLIKGFDYYERYLYFESGAYAWPKTNATKPFTNVTPSSVAAASWLGTELPNGQYGSGQLLSASLFDDYNPYKLTNTIPEHIISNPDNTQYTTFVEMIAQHFDKIWAYIDSITDLNQAYSGLKDGISKELVYEALYQRGISAFDQFKDANLYEYFIGDVKDGTFQYTSTDGSTMISASNSSTLPKGDITKEVWKRLYHNAPYLLKTKGTERGIKALLTCYGIPESILHIKEYGGPLVDKTGFRTFTYPKKSKMLNRTSNFDIITFKENQYPEETVKTWQFRALLIPSASYASNNNNIALMLLTGSGANVNYETVTFGVSQSMDPSASLDSGSFGHLTITRGTIQETVSEAVPLFNNKPWNFTVTIDSGSTDIATFYATQATQNKNVYITTASAGVGSFLDAATGVSSTFDTQFGPGPNCGFTHANASGKNTHIPFTGSMQEVRLWTELLTRETIVTQSFAPFTYNGNTISSSYEALAFRHPIGSNFETTVNLQLATNHAPNSSSFDFAATNFRNSNYRTIEEEHHLLTPDTVGSGMVSDKVRLDEGVIDNNWLSPHISTETSTQDRQPLDYSDLGIFFSPTFEINEDIIYTLGGFRLDDYIGDPRHYTSSIYPDLKTIKDIYFKKVNNRYNFFDYIRTIQFFDHTLFKMIEDFTPAKANLKTGLVIEPHYLERAKVKGTKATIEQATEHLATYSPTGSLSSVYETLPDIVIDVEHYIGTGSHAAVENVAQTSKKSRFYSNS